MPARSYASANGSDVADARTPPEIARTRLMDLIVGAGPRLLRIVAPAGYGKTTLVHQLGRRFGVFALCDCEGASDTIELARRVLGALAREAPQRAEAVASQMVSLQDEPSQWADLALRVWSDSSSTPDLFVFDNLEHIAEGADARALVGRFIATAPRARTVAACSRVPVAFRLPREIVPHVTLTLGADDLAFDHAEFMQAFYGINASRDLLRHIKKTARGWPIAILLFRRLLLTRTLASDAVTGRSSVEFEDLYDYLSDHVLASLTHSQITALLVCAVVPDATEDDIQLVLDGNASAGDLIRDALPFVRQSQNHVLAIHPLMAKTLRERFGERGDELLRRIANGHRAAGACVRAAQLFVAAGDIEAAAAALDDKEWFLASSWPLEFGQVLTQIDEETAFRHPALWTATSILRAPQLTPEEWAAKTRQVWLSLSPEVAPHIRAAAFGSYCGALLNSGALTEVERLLSGYERSLERSDFAGAMSAALIHAVLDAWEGKFGRHEEHRARIAPAIAASPGWHAQFLYETDARIYRARGARAEESRVLQHALEFARKSNMPTMPLWVLTYQAFGAWLAGEDARYQARVADLEAEIYAGVAKAFSLFPECARGRAAQASAGYERPELRSYAFLIAAATATTTDRGTWAERALAAANASAQPFPRVLANVALAEIETDRRGRLYQEAACLAEHIESEPLQQAIRSAWCGANDSGMLQSFIGRFRKTTTVSDGALSIELLSAQVSCRGAAVRLMHREFELLAALALKRRPLTAAELLEMIWPEQERTGSVVRVYASRLRSRLGRDVILRVSQGYSLALQALVDVLELESACRRFRAEAPDDETLAKLRRAFPSLCQGIPQWLSGREWLFPYVARIEELRRNIGLLIASHDLGLGNSESALDTVQELLAVDPCDEAAREVAIRARIANGDQPGAIREYRIYRDALWKQLGVEAPAWLLALATDGSMMANGQTISSPPGLATD